MDFTNKKVRLAVAAATFGALGLTSGCLIGGGLPPDPITECSSGNLIRLQADYEATQALIEAKQTALENGDVPEALIPATEDALNLLYARLDELGNTLRSCESIDIGS